MTQSGSCGAMQTLQIIAFALGPMLPHDSNLSSVESFESQMSYSFERCSLVAQGEIREVDQSFQDCITM